MPASFRQSHREETAAWVKRRRTGVALGVVTTGPGMIAWDKDHTARFLGADWSAGEPGVGVYSVEFPLADVFAELRVDAAKEEVELTVQSAAGARIASWLYQCVRVDVHDDLDETPCVTFWPPGNPLSGVSWFGIYRSRNVFSIFTGSAPSAFSTSNIRDAENVTAG